MVKSDVMRTLFVTNVGSHMWKMNHKGSDIDLFKCYLAPTYDILTGKNRGGNSHFSQDKEKNIDTASHEISKVIKELLKGNVNFLWGLFSPIVKDDSKELQELREIMMKNLSKNCYHSIHGLGYANYKKYLVEKTHPQYKKKCNIILRTLNFGINILENGKIEFTPVKDATSDDVENALEQLDSAFDNSMLPKEPQHPEMFYDWLYKLRVWEIK